MVCVVSRYVKSLLAVAVVKYCHTRCRVAVLEFAVGVLPYCRVESYSWISLAVEGVRVTVNIIAGFRKRN